MNPYHVLDLDQADAPTTGQIRESYRRLAKRAHPDAGGKPEEWERLQFAYVVLSNEDSRKKYDATGDITLGSCDNSLAETLNVIAHAVDVVREKAEAHRVPLDRVGWLEAIRRQLIEDRDQRRAQLADLRRFIDAIRGRFRRVPIGGEAAPRPDLMALLVSHYQTIAEHQAQQVAHFEKATERALKELEGYVTQGQGRLTHDPFGKYGFSSRPTGPWNPL